MNFKFLVILLISMIVATYIRNYLFGVPNITTLQPNNYNNYNNNYAQIMEANIINQIKTMQRRI